MSGNLFSMIFNNINIYLWWFQQRVTNQNTMIHATNCAVIAIDKDSIDVPKAENHEIKLRLCGKRVNVTYQDLWPTRSDDECISWAFASLIAEIIIRYTPGSNEWPEQGEMLSEIWKTMPSDWPLRARKTDTRPLEVFDVNEGSKKGLVQVLDAIHEWISLTSEEWAGKVRIILGDWLTSSNIWAAWRDQVDDVNAMERIDYSEELRACSVTNWLLDFQTNQCRFVWPLHRDCDTLMWELLFQEILDSWTTFLGRQSVERQIVWIFLENRVQIHV